MSLDPTRMLPDCCKLKTPARIILNGLICRGRFAAASPTEVVFDLLVDSQLRHSLFPQQSVGCVVFNYRDSDQVFLASVKDYKDAESAPQLHVQRLSDIASGERRWARQVPVAGKSGLRAKVKTENNKAREVLVVNISMKGMLIEFLEGGGCDLELGAQLDVELQLDDHIASLTGPARRQDGQRWGVFFLGVESSDSLRVIVNSLEWDWLQEKPGNAQSLPFSSPVQSPSVLTTSCRLPGAP